MVKANESGLYPQHSAWPPSKLNFMSTALQPRQQECLPAGISPGSCVPSARLALPRFEVPGIPDLKTEQTKDAYASLQCLPLDFQSLFPTPNPYLKGRQSLLSHGLDGNAGPNASSGSSPKRFLIFDQCGNQTRLIHNSVCLPVWSPATATTKPFLGYKSNEEEQAARVSPTDPRKYFLHEESGENKIASEESEMHEDTEEINALLYSDESDGDDDYGDDDDEVASTGHSPMAIKGIKGSYEKHEYVECIGEEVAGSDGPNKRLKLPDGGYKKSSPMETASSVKLDRSLAYDSDAESSYAIGQNQGEVASTILGKRPFKRDNIRDALRILESIIPGAEGKDPLLVIDEAIDYLKSMRHKAKSLGVSHQ